MRHWCIDQLVWVLLVFVRLFPLTIPWSFSQDFGSKLHFAFQLVFVWWSNPDENHCQIGSKHSSARGLPLWLQCNNRSAASLHRNIFLRKMKFCHPNFSKNVFGTRIRKYNFIFALIFVDDYCTYTYESVVALFQFRITLELQDVLLAIRACPLYLTSQWFETFVSILALPRLLLIWTQCWLLEE